MSYIVITILKKEQMDDDDFLLQTKEELTRLRREVVRSPKSVKSSLAAQAVLRRVENERDDALANLRNLSVERDTLRERLKVRATSLRFQLHRCILLWSFQLK